MKTSIIKDKVKTLSPMRKQLVKFTLIGMFAVLVDLTFYYLLLNVFPERTFQSLSNEAVAKSLSFICGMGVTYTLNKYWTWKLKNRSHRRLLVFSMVYSLSLIINVMVNSGLLHVLTEWQSLQMVPYKYFVSFLGATGISAFFNFVAQKYLIFRSAGIPLVGLGGMK